MGFKVGDIVKGNKLSSAYTLTSIENGFIGRVEEVDDELGDMKVKIIDIVDYLSKYKGSEYLVEQEFFDLVEERETFKLDDVKVVNSTIITDDSNKVICKISTGNIVSTGKSEVGRDDEFDVKFGVMLAFIRAIKGTSVNSKEIKKYEELESLMIDWQYDDLKADIKSFTNEEIIKEMKRRLS